MVPDKRRGNHASRVAEHDIGKPMRHSSPILLETGSNPPEVEFKKIDIKSYKDGQKGDRSHSQSRDQSVYSFYHQYHNYQNS